VDVNANLSKSITSNEPDIADIVPLELTEPVTSKPDVVIFPI
jgi:hypothetical protein